jgi:hypothetical protein
MADQASQVLPMEQDSLSWQRACLGWAPVFHSLATFVRTTQRLARTRHGYSLVPTTALDASRDRATMSGRSLGATVSAASSAKASAAK